MRADRLVAVLMILQKNGRTTALSLAEELEVSERTIYRDIESLSMAGVPIYAQRGPGGGIALLDSYRTDLTGLNAGELRALLTLSVPAPLFDLGLGADLHSALRKLAAAVPRARKEPGSHIPEKVYIDGSEWSGKEKPGSQFETIRKALWEDRALRLSYYSEMGSRAGTITAVVLPLGLVAAGGEWFLVAGRDQHTVVISLDRLLAASITAERFERPEDFQLADFWQSRTLLRQRQRPEQLVDVLIAEHALALAGDYLAGEPETTSSGGMCAVTLRFETFEDARTWILGLGNAVEVTSPLSLRLSVVDYAQQTLTRYDHA